MVPISRSEGYRRSEGKEEAAIRLVEDFLKHVLGIGTTRITDKDENFRHGDLRCTGSLATIEVKGQPIGGRHKQNFVEVFEDTSAGRREHHRGGFADLAQKLCMSEKDLARVSVRRHDLVPKGKMPPVRDLGSLDYLSVSITSMMGARAVAYANSGTGLVFLYPSDYVLGEVRKAVLKDGLLRGMGDSNRDTHAVLVPNAALRWKKNGTWKFDGEGDPGAALAEAKTLLS